MFGSGKEAKTFLLLNCHIERESGKRKKLESLSLYKQGYKTVALGAENSNLHIEQFALDVRSRLGLCAECGITVARYDRQRTLRANGRLYSLSVRPLYSLLGYPGGAGY